MKIPIPKDYSDNVFINCPFDIEYRAIFRAIVFTTHDCGFIPRCAKELDNAIDVRLIKIMRIINECKYGIHDISKADLDAVTGFARFNMPLELGLFIGSHSYSDTKHFNKEKRSMIMDKDPYRYRFISDISGQDIKGHKQDPLLAINCVREFLFNNSRRTSIASSKFYQNRYKSFSAELPDTCKNLNWEIDDIEFLDFSILVTRWIVDNPY